MIDKVLNWLEAYLALGIELVATYLMTIEGVVTLIFGLFFVGLIAQLRS